LYAIFNPLIDCTFYPATGTFWWFYLFGEFTSRDKLAHTTKTYAFFDIRPAQDKFLTRIMPRNFERNNEKFLSP